MAASSGEPSDISLILAVMAPGTEAIRAQDAVRYEGIVILSLPLGKLDTAPEHMLRGKLVVDAPDYWWKAEEVQDDLADPCVSTSERF
jgi:hypothetical protein